MELVIEIDVDHLPGTVISKLQDRIMLDLEKLRGEFHIESWASRLVVD